MWECEDVEIRKYSVILRAHFQKEQGKLNDHSLPIRGLFEGHCAFKNKAQA
jgi:hypothetical protein